MYNFSAPLFWYKFIFLAEILIAEILFAYRMKKAKSPFKIAVSLICLLLFTFALPVPFYNAAYSSFLFMLIFLATLVALKFCLDESWGNIVFCGFYSYNQQHISFQFYNMLCLFLGLDANSNIYGNQMSGSVDGLQVFVFVVPHIVVYLVCWAIMAYRTKKHENWSFTLKNIKVLVLAIVIIFFNVVLNAFVVYDIPAEYFGVVNYIIICYNIFGCILALIMLVSVVGQEELAYELEIVENLWRKNEQMYELSKVNVDFINRKCHDLRHRIRNARQKEFMDENELREIEQAIDIYDGMLKTGNDVLDVVLSEESIFCAKNDIQLLCNIDGAQLNFMQQADLYTIFQNAIHNAVDAVIKIAEKDRRIIRLTVKRIKNIISVHIENYVDQPELIKFENGLPVTQSKDRTMHGFGMRSIKISTEKYGGCICAEVTDGIFSLEMMIPAPNEEQV